jgi:CBS domain-containing protein
MRIADILRSKGSSVATVAPSVTLSDLIGELARYNVGALPVVDDDGQLIGIVSERDVVRQLHAHGPDVLRARVAEFMTAGVITCAPGDKVAELARVMTDGRFRHLPVVENGTLAGIVSIGDLVKARIDLLESEREQLQSYIAG